MDGLTSAINVGLDILYKNNFKNNIFSNYIEKFFKDIKSFVSSKTFTEKVEKGFLKLGEKVNNFKDLCEKWYDAYDKFNINEINNVAKQLSSKERGINNNLECIKQNQIIQNMTDLVNSKNSKLSPVQLQICNNL